MKKIFNHKIISLLVLSCAFLASCSTNENGSDATKASVNTTTISDDNASLTLSATKTKLEVGEFIKFETSGKNLESGEFVFTSSDPSVLSIKNGVGEALKAGVVTVTVTSTYDFTISSSIEITVVNDIDGLFDVRFFNYDGTLLYETTVKEGEEAVYKGMDPVRLSTYSVQYAFSHWDKDLTNVTENLDVYAVFSESDLNDFFFEKVGSTYKFSGYGGDAETLTIPTSYNGALVTEIGSDVLKGNETVKTLIIPEGIGFINSYAFRNLPSLEEVHLPASLYDYGTMIFYNDTALKTVVLADGLTTLGEYMFQNCTALEEVSFPSSLTTLRNGAFFKCGFKTLTIPETFTNMGQSVFSMCQSLTEVTFLAKSESIPYGIFSSCTALTTVNVKSDTITRIEQSAFNTCKALTEFVMPDTITEIGNYVFSSCTALTKVELSTNLETFGESVFQNISNLGDIITLKENDTRHTIKNGMLLCDAKSVMMLLDATALPTTLNFSELGITKIADYAFYKASTSAESVDLEGVTSIGVYAFYNFAGFGDKLVLPKSLETVGERAFMGCKFTTVEFSTTIFNDGVIVERMFQNCSSLTSITIPSGFTTLGDYAFINCGTKFTSCYIPKTVTKIGKGCFNSNSKLIITYEGSAEEFAKIELSDANSIPSTIASKIIYEGK